MRHFLGASSLGGPNRRVSHAHLKPAGFALLYLVLSPAGTTADPSGVSATIHNLSTSGPGQIRSLSETEVCKFCHIPHNAVAPEALWGHALSSATYQTPELRRGRPDAREAPQPDGSSRLCLSCHDGTVALGDVGRQSRLVQMAGRQRLAPGDRGFLGTDLSGSHPISFVVENSILGADDVDLDVGVQPLAAIRADPEVRLDSGGKMQCTSCHDPHSDSNYVEGRVPRFWVKQSVNEVCAVCHAVR